MVVRGTWPREITIWQECYNGCFYMVGLRAHAAADYKYDTNTLAIPLAE